MAQPSDPGRLKVRQRNMAAAALLVASFSALELLLTGGRAAALAGAAWFLAILAGAALQRSAARAARGLGLALGTVGGVVAVTVQVLATGGVSSPFFPVFLALPLCVLALGPDLPRLVAVTGLVATVAGAAVRHLDGRGAAEVASWSVLSAGVVALAVVGALLQGRQQRELASERARAAAMEAAADEARRLGELERYAEVGRLAATISHELNNPLASAVANLRWLEGAGAEDPAEQRAALTDTREALVRIAAVVQQIRQVAHASAADRAEAAAPAAPVLTPAPGLAAVARPRGRSEPVA